MTVLHIVCLFFVLALIAVACVACRWDARQRPVGGGRR